MDFPNVYFGRIVVIVGYSGYSGYSGPKEDWWAKTKG